MKAALSIIFEIFEEMEAIAPIDILRRGGVNVTVAKISSSKDKTLTCKGRSSISVCADTIFDDVKDKTFDALILSGGAGVFEIAENADLLNMFKRHYAQGKIVAAICAAPIVLFNCGILNDKNFTSHPSVAKKIGANNAAGKTLKDANIITSQGAGSVTEFALAILEALTDNSTVETVKESICG